MLYLRVRLSITMVSGKGFRNIKDAKFYARFLPSQLAFAKFCCWNKKKERKKKDKPPEWRSSAHRRTPLGRMAGKTVRSSYLVASFVSKKGAFARS